MPCIISSIRWGLEVNFREAEIDDVVMVEVKVVVVVMVRVQCQSQDRR